MVRSLSPTRHCVRALALALLAAAPPGCSFSASMGSAGSAGEYPAPEPATAAPGARPPAGSRGATRYYSPPLYQSFVSRSVPYGAVAQVSARAAVHSTLRVREADFIKDDYYTRHGTVVLLGTEDGALVGFTTRYSVDILYPDDDLIRDGVGRPDFRESTLTLAVPRERCAGRAGKGCALRFSLERLPERGRVPGDAGNQRAFYRVFGDNDAVLVYFPAAVAGRLRELSVVPVGLERPSLAVADAIRGANRLLGQEFVLVSPTSLKLLRRHASQKSILASYGPEVVSWVAGLVGAHTVVKALLARGFEYVTMDRRRLEQVIVARGYESSFLARELVHDFDFRSAIHVHDGGMVELPALSLIDIPQQHGAHAAAYLRDVVGDASVELILFGGHGARADSGMLFVPAHHLNLNYELVRAGLARLRTDEEGALALFPEFADAAEQALEQGAGLAGRWREDREYTAAVAAARARAHARTP